MSNPLATIAILTLQHELEAAPKTKTGFVNWERNKRLQRAAVAKLVEVGMTEDAARKLAFETGRPFDTNYSKQTPK